MMNSGWDAFQDWPNGFHRLLERLREKSGERRGGQGVHKAYGALPTLIYDWAREPWGARIGKEFAEYSSRFSEIAVAPKTLQRYAPGADLDIQYQSSTDMGAALGVSMQTAQRIVVRRKSFAVEPDGMGRTSLIPTNTVEQLREVVEDTITAEQSRNLLGVGIKVFRPLVAAGVVPVVLEADRVYVVRQFSRTAICALIAKMTDGVPEMTEKAVDTAGFSKIIATTAVGRTVTDVIGAVVDGRLKPVARIAGTTGIGHLYVRMADVERVLPHKRATMSTLDAAALIGVNYYNVNLWAKAGFVLTVRSDVIGEPGLRITHEDWEAFRREYVTAGDLGRDLNSPANPHIANHLRFIGVQPISGPGTDRATHNLFRRADLTEDVLERLKALLQGKRPAAIEQRKAAADRVPLVAALVARLWNADFRNVGNAFTDRRSGRVLQVVSGHRPEMTGLMRFTLSNTTLKALKSQDDVWFAFVPNEGEEFLLLRIGDVQWRGEQLKCSYVMIGVDGCGRAQEMTEWAHRFEEVDLPEAREAPEVDRHKYAELAAAAVEKLWGVKLERYRNTFTEVGGRRLVQVSRGKRNQGTSTFIFTITHEANARFQNGNCEVWFALVPCQGTEMVLVPMNQAPWSGGRQESRQIPVKFDVQEGTVLEWRQWAVGLEKTEAHPNLKEDAYSDNF